MIDSIIRHTAVDWELVVSDASDSPVEFGTDERVRMLGESPRLGCCKGFNRAFRESIGDWIIFLNDDAEVCPGYDSISIDFMNKHPKIGLGALHYSEGCGPFKVNSAWNCIYANFGIFRKAIGEAIGFFDEDLEMYGCDNSLAIRMLMAGQGVSDIPGTKIIHHSVQDRQRIENQINRPLDNEILTKKYMPHRQQWTATYERLKVNTGTIPWAHGIQPELVNR